MLPQLFILIGLIGLQRKIRKPWLSALIYITIYLFFRLISGYHILDIIFLVIVGYFASYIYFWIAERFEDLGISFWFIMVILYFVWHFIFAFIGPYLLNWGQIFR